MSNINKRYLGILVTFIVAFCAVTTFAGCWNWAYESGEGFYGFASAVTLLAFVVSFVKVARDYFKGLED